MRYAVANILYRLRFPHGWVRATDFRPHFDGHLLNVCTIIPGGLDDSATEAILAYRLRQSYRWMRLLRVLLRKGDRVQYCLGTTKPLKQYLKAWSSWGDFASGIEPRDIVEYWRIERQTTEDVASVDPPTADF